MLSVGVPDKAVSVLVPALALDMMPVPVILSATPPTPVAVKPVVAVEPLYVLLPAIVIVAGLIVLVVLLMYVIR